MKIYAITFGKKVKIASSTGEDNNTTGTTRSVNFIRLKPLTDYSFFSENVTSGRLQLFMWDRNFNYLGYLSSSTSHTTLVDTAYGKLVYTSGYDPNIMVNYVEGTNAPTKHIPYVESKSAIEGWWGDGDTLHIESDGRLWEDRSQGLEVLDGSWGWIYGDDKVGFKTILLTEGLSGYEPAFVHSTISKYDGTIINQVPTTIDMVRGDMGYAYNNVVVLAITDTDSGWGESYIPTADEIKAYFNGWVMVGAGFVGYTTGTKYWYKRYQGIGTKATTNFGVDYESLTEMTAVPSEKAYGDKTECYKLYYKLAEPITIELTTAKGISTHCGEKCTFSVQSGIVVKEKVVPK